MVREELYFFTREDAREVSTKGQHASSLTFLETAHAPGPRTLVEQQMI